MKSAIGKQGALIALVLGIGILSGCASVPMASKEEDAAAKTFAAPPANQSGLYVYRNSAFGAALKKLVSLDGSPLGQTAKYTYFYKQIAPGKHKLTTESEFGDNELEFVAEPGKNTFVRNYMKMGVFVGGAGLEMVSEEDGKKGVLECERAKPFTP